MDDRIVGECKRSCIQSWCWWDIDIDDQKWSLGAQDSLLGAELEVCDRVWIALLWVVCIDDADMCGEVVADLVTIQTQDTWWVVIDLRIARKDVFERNHKIIKRYRCLE